MFHTYFVRQINFGSHSITQEYKINFLVYGLHTIPAHNIITHIYSKEQQLKNKIIYIYYDILGI